MPLQNALARRRIASVLDWSNGILDSDEVVKRCSPISRLRKREKR